MIMHSAYMLVPHMIYRDVHMRHLDHHMMMRRSRLDENLVLFLYA